MNEEKLRNEILERVKLLYEQRAQENKFIPGESTVHYAGRIYDENEMGTLVNSALDFWLTAGRYAEKFEIEFAKFLSMKYCLLTNSGSSANLLAISTLKSPKLGEKSLKNGDEVITTACGFPTTLNPILQNNLKPVFIDVEMGTYNIKTELHRTSHNTENTKAIFIPHTLGNPVNIRAIMEIVERNMNFGLLKITVIH